MTSPGIRSGVNWMREKRMPGDCRERSRDQRLGETRIVLQQDVAVGQKRGEHEFERRPLADDRALDLVEHGTRTLGEADGVGGFR